MYAQHPIFWSSAAALPEAALAGFAWDGADLVIGDSGSAAFGRLPDCGADGCHLICRATRQGHLIACDGRGFARLFLYRWRKRWAVSNSYATLVAGVAALGWRVTPQAWALSAWMVPSTGFDQLPWSVTAVAEISFLPNWQAVQIGRDGRATVVARPDALRAKAGLDAVLRLWLSRIVTLLTARDVALTMELTGGLDSRTCLGMVLHLRQTGQLADLSGIRFISALHKPEDLAVAQDLAAVYGFALNRPATTPLVVVPEAERYRLWRDWSLGMFSAPYVTSRQIDPAEVTLGGHGSEYLRGLPWSLERASLLQSCRCAPGVFDKFRFRRALMAAWDSAQLGFVQDAPAAFKYRWAFRLRQITGHLAQTSLRIAPLAGMDFGAWAAARPASALSGGRLQFEIMQRLMPGLASHPFENPDYRVPEGLVVGGDALVATPGAVFGFDSALPEQKDRGTASVAELCAAELEQALASGAVKLVGKSVVEAALQGLALPLSSGDSLPRRQAFRPVHATLLAGLLMRAAH